MSSQRLVIGTLAVMVLLAACSAVGARPIPRPAALKSSAAAFGRPQNPGVGGSDSLYLDVQKHLAAAYTAALQSLGSLGCDEQVVPVPDGWAETWYYEMQYADIDMLRRWNDLGNLSDDTTSNLYGALIESASPTLPAAANCWAYAENAYQTWDFSEAPLYYLSLDVPTWDKLYDEGAFRFPLDFNFTATGNGEVQYVEFTADSLVRVDVQPREWYTPAFPFLSANARLSTDAICPDGEVYVEQCFFNEQTGLFTAITTGLVVVSNCQIATQFPNGNGTSSCAPDAPSIVGHVIRRLPVRDAFCPCYIKEAEFCTAPWNATAATRKQNL